MTVRVLSRFGGVPVDLDAGQVIVLDDNGTPLAVAGEYGTAGAVRLSVAGDTDFDRTLRAFGYAGGPVVVDQLNPMPAPAGARRLTR